MTRLRLLLGAGAVALASVAVVPAASAQAADLTCTSGTLCLSDPNGLQAVVPEGQDVDFDPGISVDIFYNGTDSDAVVCYWICDTIPPHKVRISRAGQVTVTSVNWP